MNGRKWIVYLVLVSLVLSGCTLYAAPPTTAPTQATRPTRTEPTETQPPPTAATSPMDAWREDKYLSAVAEPPVDSISLKVRDSIFDGTIMLPGGFNPTGQAKAATAWFAGGTMDALLQYAKDLESQGYDRYLYWEEQESGFIFCGMDQEMNYVCINYNLLAQEHQPSHIRERYAGYITVAQCWDPTKASIFGSPEGWGKKTYQTYLPCPTVRPSGYTEMPNPTTGGYNYLVVKFDGQGYSFAKAYAQQLKDFGYNLQVTDKDNPYMFEYSFSAANAEGLWADISVSNYGMVNTNVTVYFPAYGGRNEDLWVWNGLPLPESENWLITLPSTCPADRSGSKIALPDMDYAQALAYVQQLVDYGYESYKRPSGDGYYVEDYILKQDDTAQTFYFEADGDIHGDTGIGVFPYHVVAQYDPSPEAVSTNGGAFVVTIRQ